MTALKKTNAPARPRTAARISPVAAPAVPRLLNRELSLLEFNRRVLAQAEDLRIPLLERLKYLCIVSSNLPAA